MAIVVVDDGVLRNTILGSAEILNQFPALATYRRKLQDLDKICVSCTGTPQSQEDRRDLLNAVKLTLATMPLAELRKIKLAMRLRDSDSVLLPYKQTTASGGIIDKVIF